MYNVEDLVYLWQHFGVCQKFRSQKILPRPAAGPEENRTWPLPKKPGSYHYAALLGTKNGGGIA